MHGETKGLNTHGMLLGAAIAVLLPRERKIIFRSPPADLGEGSSGGFP